MNKPKWTTEACKEAFERFQKETGCVSIGKYANWKKLAGSAAPAHGTIKRVLGAWPSEKVVGAN